MLGLAQQLLGKPIFVGWPYLVEAKIHSFTDGKHYYQVSYYTFNSLEFGKEFNSFYNSAAIFFIS